MFLKKLPNIWVTLVRKFLAKGLAKVAKMSRLVTLPDMDFSNFSISTKKVERRRHRRLFHLERDDKNFFLFEGFFFKIEIDPQS